MGLFIKNNEKPRKHCVCEVFFLPEKHAENCSKTDGSTHTAPTNMKRKASKSTIPHKTVWKSYDGFSCEAEIFSKNVLYAMAAFYPLLCRISDDGYVESEIFEIEKKQTQ